MRIAIIPARGGSKRIPRKNIIDFCGKPMIVWSIEAALKSGCFDRVIVSTDDDEIAEIALKNGAEIPFMRPATLADDVTGTTPVIKQAVEWLVADGLRPSIVCCIYATSPFLSSGDLLKGLAQLDNTRSAYAFAVTSYAFPIQRAIKINANSKVEMYYPEHFDTRSQDLEETWHDAGQFYWGTAEAWLSEKVIFGPESSLVVLPRARVQDIDTVEDLERAEWLFKAMRR